MPQPTNSAYRAVIDQLAAEQRDMFDEHNIDLSNPKIQIAIMVTAKHLLMIVERPPTMLTAAVDAITTMIEANQ